MDKRTKERIEREKLKQMIQSNPKLKAFLDAATEETGNEDLKEILMPVLQDSFDKIRMQGIQTGWYAHCLRCKEKIASCKSLDEAIKLMVAMLKTTQLKKSIKAMQEKLLVELADLIHATYGERESESAKQESD